MVIMSIDLGMARTGIALSDKNEILATPYCVFSGYGRTRLTKAVLEIVKEKNVELIIVGLPLRTDGKESEMVQKATSFATFLSKRTEIPIKMLNEAFTTVIASGKLHDNMIDSKNQRQKIDMAAAAVLLQGYLDSNK